MLGVRSTTDNTLPALGGAVLPLPLSAGSCVTLNSRQSEGSDTAEVEAEVEAEAVVECLESKGTTAIGSGRNWRLTLRSRSIDTTPALPAADAEAEVEAEVEVEAEAEEVGNSLTPAPFALFRITAVCTALPAPRLGEAGTAITLPPLLLPAVTAEEGRGGVVPGLTPVLLLPLPPALINPVRIREATKRLCARSYSVSGTSSSSAEVRAEVEVEVESAAAVRGLRSLLRAAAAPALGMRCRAVS